MAEDNSTEQKTIAGLQFGEKNWKRPAAIREYRFSVSEATVCLLFLNTQGPGMVDILLQKSALNIQNKNGSKELCL